MLLVPQLLLLGLMALVCTESDDIRLVGGTSNCTGRLEMKHQGEWRPLDVWSDWNQNSSSVLCKQLDCGFAVSTERSSGFTDQPVWRISSFCVQSESSLRECEAKESVNSTIRMELTCSESVRLVNGTSLCSGRVEVKSNQSWVSVCEGDFDQQDAEVVCREFGCGAPSVFQGALYGEVNASMWTKEFQCEGNESVLLNCNTSDSTRNTCSPDKTVGLTCSEPDDIRLVGGTSNCTGRLEMKHQGEWRPVVDRLINPSWNLKSSSVVCRQLDCGSAVSIESSSGSTDQSVWELIFSCVGSESSLRECGKVIDSIDSTDRLEVTCSEPGDVRLVGGTSSCAGRLEMKHQGEWRPVEGWFVWNLKSTSVVCKQLDCGSAVSIKRSYGSTDQPVWMIRSSCVGYESSLTECGKNIVSIESTDRLDVTCSASVRLVNGTNLCSGRVEVKSNQSWVSVCEGDFDQQDAEVVCRELGCGAASVLQGALYGEVNASMWTKEFQCEGNESVLLNCNTSDSTRNTCSPDKTVGLTCSEPDDVRLVGGTSNCHGGLEMKHQGEWRPVDVNSPFYWNLKSASTECRQLDCGSALSIEIRSGSIQPVWKTISSCVGSESSPRRECVAIEPLNSTGRLEFTCSDLLLKPIITVFPTVNVSWGQQQGLQVLEGSNFTISCSIQPQFPGGSFNLTFTGSNTTHNHTQKTVNHSANFLFPAADHTHQGNYSCVYHINVVINHTNLYSHNFSSESELLSLTVTASRLTYDVIRVTLTVLLLLLLVLLFRVLYHLWKDTRGQSGGGENVELVYYNVRGENVELVYYNVAGSRAEAGPSEESEYHLYEEIEQRGGSEAGPSSDQYEEIDLQVDVEAGPSDETEYHQYEEVDL